MTKGIYKITNNRTGESYIGQTNNLERRKKEHFDELAMRCHHNRGMQSDYNCGDRFTFTVLEEVNGNRRDLHEQEKFYIQLYDTFYHGYNQTPGGEYDQYKGAYMNGGGRKVTYTPSYTTNSYSSSNSSSSSSSNSGSSSSSDSDYGWLCCIGVFIFLLLGALL